MKIIFIDNIVTFIIYALVWQFFFAKIGDKRIRVLYSFLFKYLQVLKNTEMVGNGQNQLGKIYFLFEGWESRFTYSHF